MTNTNMVVSDVRSGVGMAISMTLTNSTLFSSAVQKRSGNYITIPSMKKVMLSQIETGVDGKINSWVDSLQASSPSHQSLESEHVQDSWMRSHPSALKVFEKIMSSSKGKQIVVFLDYDGTLSPIVEDPDRAFMSNEMRAAVKDVAKYFPTAIVSGRCRAKVYSFVQLSELYYAGSHGMDIKGPKSRKHQKGNESVLFQPAREFLPMMDEVYRLLVEKTKSTPGAQVENNKFCLSVHFRRVDEKRWTKLAEQVRSVLKEYPKLKLTQGRKVLEIRPTIKWDKGKALEFLLESLGYANSEDVLPVYIGDDRTDEDAFEVLRKKGKGFGILVSKSPKETAASYSLQEPSEASDEFLAKVGGMENELGTTTLERQQRLTNKPAGEIYSTIIGI